MPVVDPVNAEEWDYLDIDVLRPTRSSRVCMTCQHFRYEVGRHCVTLLTTPIHQGLIPQGEHLTRKCFQWSTIWRVAVRERHSLKRVLVVPLNLLIRRHLFIFCNIYPSSFDTSWSFRMASKIDHFYMCHCNLSPLLLPQHLSG